MNYLSYLEIDISDKKLSDFLEGNFKYIYDGSVPPCEKKLFFSFKNIEDYRLAERAFKQLFTFTKNPKKLIINSGVFCNDVLSNARQWTYCDNARLFWFNYKTLPNEKYFNINIQAAQRVFLEQVYYNEYICIILGFERFIDLDLIENFKIIKY